MTWSNNTGGPCLAAQTVFAYLFGPLEHHAFRSSEAHVLGCMPPSLGTIHLNQCIECTHHLHVTQIMLLAVHTDNGEFDVL
jgi:hypothetical protein